MLGAIVGDIIGSRFEFTPNKSKSFDLFVNKKDLHENDNSLIDYLSNTNQYTDDTVMTIAICKALLDCNGDYSNLGQTAVDSMRKFGRKYPQAGYGNIFYKWIFLPIAKSYNSFGNGSAMRISSVPYFANSLDEVKKMSRVVTEVTHNHPEGIKGAEAIAVCVWMALHNSTKEEIKKYVEDNYYSLDFDYNKLVESYEFDATCQGSVPQSIYGFLISNSYEDTIRTVVSMGGDSDTMGAIAGAIAGAYYGVPEEIENKAMSYLDETLLKVVKDFKLTIDNH